MTRKTTAQLRQQIAQQEAADDALAAKLQAVLSWIGKAERARIERDEALKAAIDEDRAAFIGELRVMSAEIASTIADLRGQPVQIDAADTPRIAAE